MKNRSCLKFSSGKDVIPIAYGYPGEEFWEDEQAGTQITEIVNVEI
jgi:hypothetical protein